MKRLPMLMAVLFLTGTVFSQDKLGIGIAGSLDFNFYKYSNFKFRDDERTNKISTGFSGGVLFNYRVNDNIDLYSAIVYAVKKYSPDRLFDFGILRRVEMNALEVPVNLKFKRKDWR